MPDAAVTSDFIVGFCGETDEDFEQTVELVRESRFKNSFIFKYSERPGTKGAELYPDDVPEDVKRRRNNELLAIQNAISEEDNQPFIGRQVEVLVEGPSKSRSAARRRTARRVAAGRPHALRPDRGVRRQSPPDRPAAARRDLRRQRVHAVRQRGHRARRAGSVYALRAVQTLVTDASQRHLRTAGPTSSKLAAESAELCIPHDHRPTAPLSRRSEPGRPWLESLGPGRSASGPTATWCGWPPSGVTLDLLADICDQLAEHLPRSSDPDMALNNLERFVAAARNPLSLGSLFERDREALPILLQIFATSQHLSDLLITDTESYDLLRMTEGQPVARETLVDELCAEVAALADDEPAVMTALRRFKRRETLRIAYGDIIRGQRARHRHAADFVPGRRDRRSGRAWPRGSGSTAARGAAHARRRAGAVRRAGAGQARRRRAELFQRHRPDVPVRCRPRQPTAAQQQATGEYLRPAGARSAASC